MAGLLAPRIIPLDQWPGARCNADFCALDIRSGGREWRFLMARSRNSAPLRDLAAACERVDVVIADRRLPASCRPAVLKADRAALSQSGGLAFDLADSRIVSVAEEQGRHGW
jgi:competence protein ComEC